MDLIEDEEIHLLPGFNRSCSMISIPPRSITPRLIDNSTLKYYPIYLSNGATLNCRPDVLIRCPQVIRDLDLDVRQCMKLLPKSTHTLIRKTIIWVNTTYYYGLCSDPINVNHSTAHHHEDWLISVFDRPEKAPGIEIYNCFEYRKMRWHWNGCGLLLHELCHIIHQFCLGLDNKIIEDAYQKAKDSGKLDEVLRRDWAGLESGETDMAYAMVNAKEFFAELSVAYWSEGYDETIKKNPNSMKESSPPFTSQHIIERLDPNQYSIAEPSLFRKISPFCRPSLRLPPHCNKFYPFTRGQFQELDADLFEVFHHTWMEIGKWEISNDDSDCCNSLSFICLCKSRER
jgi:hypothetical protein